MTGKRTVFLGPACGGNPELVGCEVSDIAEQRDWFRAWRQRRAGLGCLQGPCPEIQSREKAHQTREKQGVHCGSKDKEIKTKDVVQEKDGGPGGCRVFL